jgi:hypothetical protein
VHVTSRDLRNVAPPWLGYAAWFALLVSVTAGCGQRLAQADKAAIHSVSVNRDVTVAEEPFYMGPAQAVGMAFGIVGALVGEAMAGNPKAVLRATLRKNNIEIGSLAAEEFTRQLQSAGVFGELVPMGGESEIRLEVPYWGLAKAPLSTELKPVFGMKAKLVKADGSVAWEKYFYIANMNSETPSATFETFIENPEQLRAAFAKASEIVALGLVEDLRH